MVSRGKDPKSAQQANLFIFRTDNNKLSVVDEYAINELCDKRYLIAAIGWEIIR